jgi:hypothetical protein
VTNFILSARTVAGYLLELCGAADFAASIRGLAAGAAEFAHETDESFDGFEGDGVVEGDAHAAEVLLFDLA